MDERRPAANKMRNRLLTNKSRQLKRMALIVGPIFCLSVCGVLQPSGAFLHCFTPNMFKMGKLGHPGGAYMGHPGERANWYPQTSNYQTYGQNPMSRLFKSKWMSGGGGLFGSKRWMDWRQNSANMNLYRPNQYAYWPPVPPAAFAPLAPSSLLGGSGKQGYNQFSDQLSLVPPYSSTNNAQLLPPTSGYNYNYNYNTPGSYQNQSPSSQLNSGGGSGSTSANSNDGWSYPSVSPYSRPASGGTGQTSQTSSYGSDSYSVSPNSYQPAKQQVSPYGTKGGSGGIKTAKKVLVADGV